MARLGLGSISSKLPADVRQFLDRVRDFISGSTEFITRRELVDAGVISVDRRGNVLAGDSGEANTLPPPAPTNVAASGAMTNILVDWDAPIYSNHAYAEVWASGVDDLGQAVLVGTSLGVLFAHAVGAGQTRYYWVRFVSKAGIPGPFNAVAGTLGQTANDPAWLLQVLTDQLSEDQLVASLNTRIDLVDGDGAGSVNERIATETQARVAAIDQEVTDRNTAISTEARQRIEGVQTTAEAALRAVLSGHQETAQRVGDVALARSELRSELQTGLSAEASSRLILEAKVDVNSAAITSEQTARATGDSANASSISALSAQVNDPTTGLAAAFSAITSEQTTRSTADTAEASARGLLAAQLRGSYEGSDLSQVTTGLLYDERTARVTEDLALAQQITLLSAGAGEQFDWQTIWYFDSGVESWDGNGTPTASAGWLRPANHATDPYVFSGTGIGADGAKYSQVRLRIRKTGTLTFEGYLWWRASGDATWDAARRVALTEPTYDANGIGLITVSPGWAVTVDRVRVDLSTVQDASNYMEIDWVAIGRPSPGASSAQLLTEQTARAAADSAETTARQALSTKLTGQADPSALTLGTLASGLLYDEKSARSSADSAMASDISTLQATVTSNYTTLDAAITDEETARSTADSAEATARQSLSTKLTGQADPSSLTLGTLASGLLYDERQARASEDSALASDISTLNATVGDLQSAITDEQTARVDGDAATAFDIETLYTGVRQQDQSAQEAAETLLRNTLSLDAQQRAARDGYALIRSEMRTEFVAGISAESTARQILAARVTENESSIQTEQTARANADSAMASDITTLQTTVGGHTTSIQQQAESIDGIRGVYWVKIDNNGNVSGFGLASDLIDNGTALSKFIASVDQFAVVAPMREAGTLASVPFAVLTTQQTINGVLFEPGVYIDGASINTGTVGNAQIGSLAADKIVTGNLATDVLTANVIAAINASLEYLSAERIDAVTFLAKLAAIETAYITDAHVENLSLSFGKIKNDIQSTNYAVGEAGWKIDTATGSAEFNNATVRGTVYAADGEFSGSLNGANITGATGVFSGTLAAGVFDPSIMAGRSVELSYSAVLAANGLSVTVVGGGVFSFLVPDIDEWIAGTIRCRVTLVGGGAGGGGGASSANEHRAASGGGGGSGGILLGYDFAVDKGDLIAVSIGANGAGGAVVSSVGQSGTAGGTTTLLRNGATVATANGGNPGTGGNPYTPSGGVGGTRGAVSYGTNAGASGQSGAVTAGMGASAQGGPGGAGYGSYGNGGNGADTHVDVDYSGHDGSAGYAYVEIYDQNFVVINTRYRALVAWLDTLGHGSVPSAAR